MGVSSARAGGVGGSEAACGIAHVAGAPASVRWPRLRRGLRRGLCQGLRRGLRQGLRRSLRRGMRRSLRQELRLRRPRTQLKTPSSSWKLGRAFAWKRLLPLWNGLLRIVLLLPSLTLTARFVAWHSLVNDVETETGTSAMGRDVATVLFYLDGWTVESEAHGPLLRLGSYLRTYY